MGAHCQCLVPKLNYNSALTYYSRMYVGPVLGTLEPIIARYINLSHCNIVTCYCIVNTGPGSAQTGTPAARHRGELTSSLVFCSR